MKYVKLNNNLKMPMVGLGTFEGSSSFPYRAVVSAAYKAGYRLIDTASSYDNQIELGKALKSLGVSRSEYFLTSKVANNEQGYYATLKSFEQTVKELQTDYLDLFLVHWPKEKPFFETWSAMEHLYKEGYVRAIGVSNFEAHHLDRLLTKATVLPAVDQVETHPYFNQHVLRSYLKKLDIQQQAWSPLGQGVVFNDPTLIDIAKRYGVSVTQIILRWHLQSGVAVIPKSSSPVHIRENMDLDSFSLTIHEMSMIESLQRGERIMGAPDENYKADLW